jgi:hypothetical protein
MTDLKDINEPIFDINHNRVSSIEKKLIILNWVELSIF